MLTREASARRLPGLAAVVVSLFVAAAIYRLGRGTAILFLAPSLPQSVANEAVAVGLRSSKTSPVHHRANAFVPQTGLAAAACVAFLAIAGVTSAPRRLRRSAAATVRRVISGDEWVSRVRMIEGERAVFEVTIPKPLGLTPRNFPNRPGVGIAKIAPDGNADKVNRKVLIDEAKGMWVLEGDEVVAVNGVNVEGKSVDDIGPLVKECEGDVTLTLCRFYNAGPVKVVFLPSGKVATMKRGIEILNAAEVGVQEVSYSCEEGWCKSCWHTDANWGTIYRCCSAQSKKRPPPKNPRTIPENWFNVMPLVLLNWPESLKRARKDRKRQEALREKAKERSEA